VLTKATHLTCTAESSHHPGMNRRRFLLTSLAGAVAVPLAAGGQPAGKVWHIGVLGNSASPHPDTAFQQGLRDLG
jgi:hypothetical protein